LFQIWIGGKRRERRKRERKGGGEKRKSEEMKGPKQSKNETAGDQLQDSRTLYNKEH
jgi:hypothetical protein